MDEKQKSKVVAPEGQVQEQPKDKQIIKCKKCNSQIPTIGKHWKTHLIYCPFCGNKL